MGTGYNYICKKCGGVMHVASKDEMNALPCPKCGDLNALDRSFMWD